MGPDFQGKAGFELETMFSILRTIRTIIRYLWQFPRCLKASRAAPWQDNVKAAKYKDFPNKDAPAMTVRYRGWPGTATGMR